jgi:cytochrome c biogenesis protein CcmG/thiol:disulfide interchange protein DsbE
MRRRSLFAILLALGFIGLLTFGLVNKGASGPQPGDPAPENSFASLDQDSESNLEDFRGQWVLVNFWASWCEPCKEESPALEDLQTRYGGEDFTVIGIAIRDASDDSRAFVRDFELSYPQFRDRDGKVAHAWGTTGVPESFLVDPEGIVRVKQPGAVNEEIIDDLFVSELEAAGVGRNAQEKRS